MTTEADEAAFAHWYEAAQTAQREVARLTAALHEKDQQEAGTAAYVERLTAALDASQRFAGHVYCTQEIGDLRADVKGLREMLTAVCDERDAERSVSMSLRGTNQRIAAERDSALAATAEWRHTMVQREVDAAMREADGAVEKLRDLRAAVLAIAAEMTHEDRHVRHGAWAVRLREACALRGEPADPISGRELLAALDRVSDETLDAIEEGVKP